MSEPYLITGLPRSRTAWMSVAAICIHEPLKWLTRWEDVFSEVWGPQFSAPYIGVSDHALGFHLPEIIRVANPRVLIIERPIKDVETSLDALGIPASNYCRLLHSKLRYNHANIRRVSYESLSSTCVVANALKWLMPNTPIDVFRIGCLQEFNIQAKLSDVKRAAERRASDAAAILGADVMAELRLA